MEENSKIAPIIVGYEHHNTLSVIRCFGQQGIKVDVILCGCKDSYIALSAYIKKLVYISCSDELQDALCKDFLSTEKRLIVSCADQISSEIDRCYSLLSDKFYFSNCCEEGKLTYFMNKEVQLKIANEVGLDIPETYHLETACFPCLIKPVESINGGKHIAVANNKDELTKALEHYHGSNAYTIEQFLIKDREIVLAGLSVGGKIIIPGYIEKIREIAGGTTYSKVHSLDSLPAELINSAKELVHRVNYTGLFGIELIQVGSTYYFIELNLRNDATTYSFVYGGVNLPYLYWKLIIEESYQFDDRIKRTEYFSMVENRDFRFVLNNKVSIFRWVQTYYNTRCRYVYERNDKRIHLIIFSSMFKLYCRNKARRIFK